MSLERLLEHSVKAYERNVKLISLFSVPFLVAFPLALLLPNFIAVSGVFLRLASIEHDLDLGGALLISGAFLVSLLLFSFAVAAINVIIRHERTLNKVSSLDFENIEEATYKLFAIFLAAFLLILVANYACAEYLGGQPEWLAPLLTLGISLSVLFAPQAIILEEVSLFTAVKRSAAILYNRFYYFVFFICLASILLLLNGYIFLHLQDYWAYAGYAGIAVNALVITPFFEVLKAQIFLSKYALLK